MGYSFNPFTGKLDKYQADTDTDEKVKIDAAATAGYLGAASNDGVLRTSAPLTYTDGGDFITLGLDETVINHNNLNNLAIGDVHTQYVLKSGSLTQITTRSHADLQNLLVDDHTQYALLAGRAGGQTLIGDTTSGGNLTLQSTAHATKGRLLTDPITLTVPAAATIGQIIKGAASQSANLLEIQKSDATIYSKFDAIGRLGLQMGATALTAYLHLGAGTATASTAPIKLTAGTVLATPEAGTIEFDGTDFFLTT